MAAAADTSFTSEVARDILECAICRSRYQQPKMLSCQHTFCLGCLKDWLKARKVKTNLIKCALCRFMTDLPSRGVDGLPDNLTVKGMLSIVSKRETKTPKGFISAVSKPTPVCDKKTAGNCAKKCGTRTCDCACKNSDVNSNTKRKNRKSAKVSNVFEDSDSSQWATEESDESTDEDCASEEDDSSFLSSFDSDAPDTPPLKNYGGIKVGMKVYIFNRHGKRYRGHVKLLENCRIVSVPEPRTYAGIELTRHRHAPVTEDVHLMDHSSYLATWLDYFDKPCTVVRADDCIPASIVDKLASKR